MYAVRWTERSREDLILKTSRMVSVKLVQVAETALTLRPQPADPDEGYGTPPELWRRGLTRLRRKELTLTEATLLDDGAQPWDYVLVYRPFRRGYLVLAVLTNREIGALYTDRGQRRPIGVLGVPVTNVAPAAN